MNDTTMQMTTSIPTGLGTPTCGHDLGAISGRVAPSGAVKGAAVRDRRDGYVLGTADETFPGSPAWRPPIT